MRLVHINLVVRDPEVSARFYVSHLLPDATLEWLGDSLHVRGDGSDLAFQPGEPRATLGAHHGFVADSATSIDALATRLTGAGVVLTEDTSEEGFRSIKFRDPDGYECEVYWEVGWP